MADTLQVFVELIKNQGVAVVLLGAILYFLIKNMWPWYTAESSRKRAEEREDRLRRDANDAAYKDRTDTAMENLNVNVKNSNETLKQNTETTERISKATEGISAALVGVVAALERSKSYEDEVLTRFTRVETKVDDIGKRVDDISEKIK